MLCTLIRRREAFEIAKTHLTPAHFTAGEMAMSIVWAAAQDFVREHNELPTEQLLVDGITDRVERDDTADDRVVEELNELLGAAFASPPDFWNVPAALQLLKKFLEDRLAREMGDLLQSTSRTPDVLNLLSEFATRAGVIQSVSTDKSSLPFPQDWSLRRNRLEIIRTGLSFLDFYMNGGYAPGEVNLVLGPYRGGKSTLSVQLAISAAAVLWEQWEVGGREGPVPLVYYVSYEDPLVETRLRALANAAEIPFDTLAAGNPSILSTIGSLHDYERRRWNAQLMAGVRVEGERERLARAITRVNRNVRFIDFSGTDPEKPPQLGTGLQPELYSTISGELLQPRPDGRESRCALVIVDWVGAAVQRYLSRLGSGREQMRHYVSEFPLALKNTVLGPLRAAGFVMHQFDSKHQKIKPGQLATHMDSAEGKQIGASCHFCFNLLAKTDEGLLAFNCSKARRAQEVPPRILQFRGEFAQLVDTDGAYMLDRTSQQIVARREYERVESGGGNGSGSDPYAAGPPRPASALNSHIGEAFDALRGDRAGP